MTYKILIKAKTSNNYTYYTQQVGTEFVDYSTTHIEDLAATYKSLLAVYPSSQLKLVHELEPEIVINLEDEGTLDSTSEDEETITEP